MKFADYFRQSWALLHLTPAILQKKAPREVNTGIKKEPAVEETKQGWDGVGGREDGAPLAPKAMEMTPQALEQNRPWNYLSGIFHIIVSVQQAS